MIKKIILYISLSLSSFGEIYTLDDVQLDFPKAQNLKEEVIYSFIFDNEKKSILNKLEELKNDKVIDALDYYQYVNLLKNEDNYQEYYFVDEDLLLLKKLSLAEDNQKAFIHLIEDSYNKKYIYEYFIHRAFHHYKAYMDPYILNLKSSSSQFSLYIKYNYLKENFIYLKSMMRKLKGRERLLILDLIIEGNKNLSNENKIKLIEQRNDMSYEKAYSFELIKLYETEKLYFSMLAEINIILEEDKNFNLVKKIIEHKQSELTVKDFAELKNKIEESKISELRYLIISKLYENGQNFEKLLPEKEPDLNYTNEFNYFKIIEYVKKNEPRKAYLVLSAVPEELQEKSKFSILRDQLNILLDQAVNVESSPHFKLSKRLNDLKLFKNNELQNEDFITKLNSNNYKLSDFYKAYEKIDSQESLALLQSIIIYEKIKNDLVEPQKNQLKSKMEALGFE